MRTYVAYWILWYVGAPSELRDLASFNKELLPLSRPRPTEDVDSQRLCNSTRH